MNKKISVFVAISLAFIVATITLTLTMVFSMKYFDSMVQSVKERESMYHKISEIDHKIRQNYFGDIDEETLNNHIAQGIIDGINDDYAEYYTSAEYKALLNSNKGEIVGIGVEVYRDPSGYIKIREIYENSSAYENGIKAGDVIKKIEGEDVLKIGYNNAVALLKGDQNTRVSITVQSGGDEKVMSLLRKVVIVNSVSYSNQGNIGYIRIKSFNEKTPSQFISAVDDLRSQGVIGLVFDVRNNGGGLLDSVCSILDYILPEGVIVSAKYKDGKTEVLAKSDKSELNMPMVVLQNASTASASELFVSALRDYEKAIVVGTTTYGKGVMQNTFNLSDGSAIKFTIAEYNPPKSNNYNKVGVKPDFEVKLTSEQEKNVFIEDIANDLQFIKAAEILKTR